jgi:ADP-ribose pyrophosphatase
MIIEQIETQLVYQGSAFKVSRDRVRFPNGRETNFDIVHHNDAVTIAPLTDDGAIWFIRQYRYPAGQMLLELPAGVMEDGENPLISAQRELREEIGLAAKELKMLGGCFLAAGYSNEYMHIFLATGLYPNPLPGDENEFLEAEKIPLAQAMELARTGAIQDAKSLAALFWIVQAVG